LSLVFLSGCAGIGKEYYDSAEEISDNNRVQATLIIQSQMELDAKVAESLKDNDVALVLYAMQSKDKMVNIAKLLETELPEAPTTANDVWLGFGTTFIEGATTIGKWYIGASLIESIFDGYGTAYNFTAGGDQSISDSLNTTDIKLGNENTFDFTDSSTRTDMKGQTNYPVEGEGSSSSE
jgi:hypothetical protein